MWRHLRKPSIWRSKQWFPWTTFFIIIYINKLFLKCVEREESVSVEAHTWQKVQALTRHRAERAASDQSLFFCPSKSRVFIYDVTFVSGFWLYYTVWSPHFDWQIIRFSKTFMRSDSRANIYMSLPHCSYTAIRGWDKMYHNLSI